MYGALDIDKEMLGGEELFADDEEDAHAASSRRRRVVIKSETGKRGSSSSRGGERGGEKKHQAVFSTIRAANKFKSAARRRKERANRRRVDVVTDLPTFPRGRGVDASAYAHPSSFPPSGGIDASAYAQPSSFPPAGGIDESAYVQPLTKVPPSTGTKDHRHHHHRSWLYTLLNPNSHRTHAVFFKRFMLAVICIDLCFFVCSTEPQWEGHPVFYYEEGVASIIFLIEYIARFVTCTESSRFGPLGPILGRLRFMVTMPAIIDALATFPFFIEHFSGVDLPTMTFLRFFRLLRIGKTEGFARAFESVNRVIYYNREILYVAAMLCIFLVLVTAVAMYYLRPRPSHGEVDADFSSIGATMYLTTLMLTGQGGPEGDLPWYTQAIVLVTGIFSVAMFAIPASMLTWGFEAEAERLATRARRHASIDPGDVSSSSSESSDAYASSSSIDTSDEEYQKIIGGDDVEEEGTSDGASKDSEKARALKEIMDMFTKADDDGSGTLTKQEFVKMAEKLLATSAEAGAGNGNEGPGRRVSAPQSAIASKIMTASMASTSQATVLTAKVARLEAKVDELTSKLDRLLQISERAANLDSSS